MAENLRPGDYVTVKGGLIAKVVSVGKGLIRVEYYDGSQAIVTIQNVTKYQ